MRARKRKTHFVPKVVYQTAFAGVVPLCVASLACSSSSSGGSSGPQLTVACGGFCGAVAQAAFIDAGDANSAADAPSGDAATDSDYNPCPGNFCGVGVAAFVDSGDSGDTG
jgi:hypothetical protein